MNMLKLEISANELNLLNSAERAYLDKAIRDALMLIDTRKKAAREEQIRQEVERRLRATIEAEVRAEMASSNRGSVLTTVGISFPASIEPTTTQYSICTDDEEEEEDAE